MWVSSPIDLKKPLKWGGQEYPIRKGVNELPDDVGKAYFLYDFQLPPEMEASLKGKSQEIRDYVYDETLMVALGHALRRHGKTKADVDWLKGFTCTKTREELEKKIEGPKTEKTVTG